MHLKKVFCYILLSFPYYTYIWGVQVYFFATLSPVFLYIVILF